MPLVGTVIALAVAAPASAQSSVEIKSSTPEQQKQLEIVAPGPAIREKSRVPEADFYGDDQRVPFDRSDPTRLEPSRAPRASTKSYVIRLVSRESPPDGSGSTTSA